MVAIWVINSVQFLASLLPGIMNLRKITRSVMAPQTRQLLLIGKAVLSLLRSKGVNFYKQLIPSESADYQTWRHRFLASRQQLLQGSDRQLKLIESLLEAHSTRNARHRTTSPALPTEHSSSISPLRFGTYAREKSSHSHKSGEC